MMQTVGVALATGAWVMTRPSDDAGTLQFDAGDFDAGVVGADAQFENDNGS